MSGPVGWPWWERWALRSIGEAVPLSVLQPLVLSSSIVLAIVALGFVFWRPSAVVGAPRRVLGLLGGLTVLAFLQIFELPGLELRLWLDPSEESLMVREDPARAIYDLATKRFGGDDRYIVVIEGSSLFDAASLARLRDLGEALGRIPQVRRSESLINAKDYFYETEADLIDIGAFVREIPDDPQALRAIRERALADPVYPKYLVAKDGRAVALDLSLFAMSDREWIESGADARIRDVTQRSLTGDQEAYFSGRPHIKARAYHQMLRDFFRLIPLAVAVASIVALLLTRSLRATLLPVAASLAAALWTAAALVVSGSPLNLITLVLPSTLISLGGLYGIHVMGRYQVERRAGGGAAEVALRTLRYSLLPVTVAGFTTCIGFAALLLAKTPATTELGLFAVCGIAFLTVISLTGIPAALALLPLPKTPQRERVTRPIEWCLDGFARLSTGRPGLVLAVWAVAAAGAAGLVWWVEVDTDYLTFFDRDASVVRDFEAIHRLLGGPVPLFVTLEDETEGAFRKPANLRALETIAERLQTVPGVDSTLSMVESVRKMNRAFEGDDPAQERIPDTEAEVSDLVFLIPKTEMRRFASSNHRAVNVVVRTGEQGSRAIRTLERAIYHRLEDERLVPPGMRAAVTGNAIVLNRSADRIATDQFRCVGFASLAILVLMCGLFRSLGLGLLAMVPNWLPVLLFFGLLGSGAATLSLPTGLIGSLSLGVAIDDSVHILVGYMRLRRAGKSPEGAIARTVRDVGRPVVVTSAMLVAGFLTITLSGFATLREFGALTAATMLLCLGTDLLLLPALLVRSRA